SSCSESTSISSCCSSSSSVASASSSVASASSPSSDSDSEPSCSASSSSSTSILSSSLTGWLKNDSGSTSLPSLRCSKCKCVPLSLANRFLPSVTIASSCFTSKSSFTSTTLILA